MKHTIKIVTALTVSAVLAACGSTPKNSMEELNKNIPEWVLNPVLEDGIASSVCVASSGHMSTDKSQATALARVELAQQIDTRVRAMDKTYQEKISVGDKTTTGITYNSVSKQLTDQALTGSRVIKTAYANFDGKNQLCVLAAMGQSSTKELFDNIINASDRQLTMNQEEVLYLEFKAQKLQGELESELEKMN